MGHEMPRGESNPWSNEGARQKPIVATQELRPQLSYPSLEELLVRAVFPEEGFDIRYTVGLDYPSVSQGIKIDEGVWARARYLLDKKRPNNGNGEAGHGIALTSGNSEKSGGFLFPTYVHTSQEDSADEHSQVNVSFSIDDILHLNTEAQADKQRIFRIGSIHVHPHGFNVFSPEDLLALIGENGQTFPVTDTIGIMGNDEGIMIAIRQPETKLREDADLDSEKIRRMAQVNEWSAWLKGVYSVDSGFEYKDVPMFLYANLDPAEREELIQEESGPYIVEAQRFLQLARERGLLLDNQMIAEIATVAASAVVMREIMEDEHISVLTCRWDDQSRVFRSQDLYFPQ